MLTTRFVSDDYFKTAAANLYSSTTPYLPNPTTPLGASSSINNPLPSRAPPEPTTLNPGSTQNGSAGGRGEGAGALGAVSGLEGSVVGGLGKQSNASNYASQSEVSKMSK